MPRFPLWLLPLSMTILLATACSSPGGSAAQPTRPAAPTPQGAPTRPAAGGATGKQWPSPPPMTIDPNKQYSATLKTDKGEVVVALLPKEAPIAVNNFVFLARQGFYDNVPIHRIVQGFVIQSGDPTGTGTGGPGYTIPDEKVSLDYKRGAVAMARTPAPNSAGSQFFICLQDIQLPKQYVIFGQVTSGMDVVDQIAQTPVKAGPSGERSTPITPVMIQSVTVSER
jgi:peptidylprolyl isomerase